MTLAWHLVSASYKHRSILLARKYALSSQCGPRGSSSTKLAATMHRPMRETPNSALCSLWSEKYCVGLHTALCSCVEILCSVKLQSDGGGGTARDSLHSRRYAHINSVAEQMSSQISFRVNSAASWTKRLCAKHEIDQQHPWTVDCCLDNTFALAHIYRRW